MYHHGLAMTLLTRDYRAQLDEKHTVLLSPWPHTHRRHFTRRTAERAGPPEVRPGCKTTTGSLHHRRRALRTMAVTPHCYEALIGFPATEEARPNALLRDEHRAAQW